MRPTLESVNFRISAPELDFYVDVHLRSFGYPDERQGAGERWLAVADIAGENEVGMGRSPHEALAAPLTSLGAQAISALLAHAQVRGVEGSAPQSSIENETL